MKGKRQMKKNRKQNLKEVAYLEEINKERIKNK